MIVKRVRANKVKGKDEHIAHLVRYITNNKDDAEVSDHKVGHIITRGFISTDLPTQVKEMKWLAAECVRSKVPINHYVLSWKEGELPSAHQCEEAVDLFVNHLGLTGCQVIAALHTDTHNRHLHIAVNRIDQETFAALEINKGFDREAAHQAIAIIEHLQGWVPEKNARFSVGPDGELINNKKQQAQKQRIPAAANDFEIRTGERSHARAAIDAANDVFKEADSWSALHRRLHGLGMKYTRVGSGAVIEFEGEVLKASTVSRLASLPKLQKKLGQFEPAGEGINEYFKHEKELYIGENRGKRRNSLRVLSECTLAPHGKGEAAGVLSIDVGLDRREVASLRRQSTARTDIRSGERSSHRIGSRGNREPTRSLNGQVSVDQLANEYQQARRLRREAKEKALADLRLVHDNEYRSMKARQSALRAELIKRRSWKGRGELRNAFSSAIKLDHDAELALLRKRQALERAAIRAQYKPWFDYEAWLVEKDQLIVVDQRRYPAIELVFLIGFEYREARPVAIAGYDTIIDKTAVHYRKKGSEEISFTDRGRHIAVYDSVDESVVLDAMRVAQAKWGVIEVNGSTEFKALCVRLAVGHGIELSNPELKSSIEAARLALIDMSVEPVLDKAIERVDSELEPVESVVLDQAHQESLQDESPDVESNDLEGSPEVSEYDDGPGF